MANAASWLPSGCGGLAHGLRNRRPSIAATALVLPAFERLPPGRGRLSALRVQTAEKALRDATAETQAVREAPCANEAGARGPGRPPEWRHHVAVAVHQESIAANALAEARAEQESMREVVRGLSATLHPIDVRTGAQTDEERVDAAERATQGATLDGLLCRLRAAPAWQALDARTREELIEVASECAGWFVRCTGSAEGHNGWLRLRSHQLHVVTADRLETQRALNDFLIRRADGTTAAERLLRATHGDLIEDLTARMPLPAMPRRRPRPARWP